MRAIRDSASRVLAREQVPLAFPQQGLVQMRAWKESQVQRVSRLQVPEVQTQAAE